MGNLALGRICDDGDSVYPAIHRRLALRFAAGHPLIHPGLAAAQRRNSDAGHILLHALRQFTIPGTNIRCPLHKTVRKSFFHFVNWHLVGPNRNRQHVNSRCRC